MATTPSLPAGSVLDYSSLARFSTAGLLDCLADRRRSRRAVAAMHGRDSVAHRAAIASIYRVVTTLEGRGVAIPDAA